MSIAAPFFSQSTYWYLTRASGLIALGLFTVTFALGLLTAGRVSSPRWPRFVTETLHRNMSLASVAFVVVHAVTILLDDYVQVGVAEMVVPFIGGYLPLWVGLGAIAFDVLLVVVLTSLIRTKMSYRSWRIVHWLAYLGWPIALVHTIGIGSDRLWVLIVVGVSAVAVLGCGAYRLAGWRRAAMRRPL